MTKSFEKWSEQEVIEVFGLRKNKSMQLLQDWIRIEGEEIAVEKRNRLEELRVLLEDFANAFNEEDIKFHFISQLIGLIQFITPQYRPFLETTITTTKNDIHNTPVKLRGRVEFLVAKGRQIPRAPFFFLKEYKPELKSSSDPLGQLLIAMLASQSLNATETPIYGCYVVGRNWFFVMLAGQEYSVSVAFDATTDEIYGIYKILCKCKAYIDAHL